MATRPRVALLVESSRRAYGRGLLHGGIAEYVRLHGPWSICLAERGLRRCASAWLQGWSGDGIIARVENRQELPGWFVSWGFRRWTCGAAHRPRGPQLITDDTGGGEPGGQHLRERGSATWPSAGFGGRLFGQSLRGVRPIGGGGYGFTCHICRAERPRSHAAGTEAREQSGWSAEAEVALDRRVAQAGRSRQRMQRHPSAAGADRLPGHRCRRP